jgi:nitroreductase/dihydropteridine reductase
MSTFLGSTTWRRATKAFGSSGPVPDVRPIAEAIRMAPSSFGIQPYFVQVVSDEATKAALLPLCYSQPQITQCTHLFVFCAAKDCVAAGENFIAARQLDTHAKEFAGMVRGSMGAHASQGAGAAWCAKQAYIALGFALAAAAELRISSCPMEGFSPEGIAGVLKVPGTHAPVCLLAVGRTHEDAAAASGGHPQWRFPLEQVVKGL